MKVVYIQVNNWCYSGLLPVISGDPQGSIFISNGPVLFLIYINDLQPTSTSSEDTKYFKCKVCQARYF